METSFDNNTLRKILESENNDNHEFFELENNDDHEIPESDNDSDNDYDNMEVKYRMYTEKRNNRVQLYKKLLLNIISIGIIGDRYDSFDIKLKDWSNRIDGYTKLLEQIYDKYENK
jgi:hypothetical protein